MPFSVTNATVAAALAERGYAEPTPVQAAIADPAVDGADLLVSAKTGSGKTVAYGLALLPSILGTAERFDGAGVPLAVVVAPTRELALQVHRELSWLYGKAGARVATAVGGMDPVREKRAMMAGAHVVVGTPGRLRDHIERGQLVLAGVKAVVLDEADEMLNLGFREDIEFILDQAPAERRTLLFSATIPSGIARLAGRYQRDALRLEVAADESGHADIEHRALRTAPHEVEKTVVNVLRWYDPRAAIVFCATRDGVARLSGALKERGFDVVSLSGELTQAERNRALAEMRDGRARVCVATDVAARGIDLPDLALVVHADLPHDSEVLTHRSGRTGRAGRKGTAVLVVPHNRRRKAESLLAGAGIVASWSAPPSAEDVRRLDRDRLAADPLLTEEASEEDLGLARSLIEAHGADAVTAALVRLWRQQLPAPEELSADVERAPRPALDTGDPAVWFRLAVGRDHGAEVRHVLPLICRRTGLTKRDVGTIRIGARETLFAVTPAAAGSVAHAAADAAAGEIAIAPVDGPAAVEPPRRRFRDAAPRQGAKPRRPAEGAKRKRG